MAFYFALAFFILHSVQLVMSQKGEFASFGEYVGDTVVSKNTKYFCEQQQPRRIFWQLSKPFKAFGEDQNSITVRR